MTSTSAGVTAPRSGPAAAVAPITERDVARDRLRDEAHPDLVATITDRYRRDAPPQRFVEHVVDPRSPHAEVDFAGVVVDVLDVPAEAVQSR